jgi:drug/metabolite transporter (DMT)-like permease
MIYFKLVLTAFFWGGTFIAGRIVAQELGACSAAFIRFLVATIFLGILIVRFEKKLPRLSGKQVLIVSILGLTGVFAYNIFFFGGLKLIAASRASLIIANNPVVIALLSAIVLGERLGWRKAFGVFVSGLGALVVVSRGQLSELVQGQVGWGELLILGCVLSWSSYSIIGKAAMRELSPLVSVFYSAAIGDLLLLVPALREGLLNSLPTISPVVWICLVYLGICGTVLGFVWFYEGIRSIGPSRAGLFINLVPVFAVIQAFFVLNEPISPSLLIGGLLVCCGVYLTNRRSSVLK